MQTIENVRILPDGRMNAASAAAYLGLTRKTLAMQRWRGNGPPFVKRGRIFYYRDDLDEWLRSARVSSNAQRRRQMEPGRYGKWR